MNACDRCFIGPPIYQTALSHYLQAKETTEGLLLNALAERSSCLPS